jgi:hypothetical protein
MATTQTHAESHRDFDDAAAQKALSWYGWGSPIGLALFFIGLTICFAIVKFALSL